MPFSLPPSLTESQRLAVTAPEPLLSVLAGAGAGKTRVLTLRVARRVHDGTGPARHVLVCTFSRKAARELHQRLWQLQVGQDLSAGTFHRTALALIRRHRADRGAAPPVVLADRRRVLAELLGGQSGGPAPGGARAGKGGRTGPGGPAAAANRLEGEIAWAKARLIDPDAYQEAAARHARRPGMRPERVAELYAAYERERRHRGMLDLDDLLREAAQLLEHNASFAAAMRWRYRHVYVDEMQDVNPAQFRLLRALLGDEPDLCVVGDPNQSVYGWNGADPGLLDKMPALFPGTRVIRLDENHRCSPEVLAVAAAALGLGQDGRDGRDGGDPSPAPTSTRPQGPVPRIVAHETDAEEADWVAHQAWLAHRPGRRWSQIAVLARTNAQLRVLAEALERARVPAVLAGPSWGPASDVRTAPAGTRPGADRTDTDGGADAGAATGPGADRADRADRDADADTRTTAGDSGDPERADAVAVTTFHRAKGLQWPVVFVTGLADGLVPVRGARTPEARAEERRLLYVALTRAESELACTWAAYPDAGAAADGKPPRRPSPWLAAMVRAQQEAQAGQRPADPSTALAHLARIRASLATGATGDAGSR